MIGPFKSRIKKLGDCKHLISIEVSEEEVENCFREAFQRIQRKATLHGFRQGKVPLSLVESVYQDEAMGDVVRSLVERGFRASLRQHQVKTIGMPRIHNIQAKRGSNMKFDCEVETPPLLRLRDYKGIKVTKPALKVSADGVENALVSLRESRGELLPLEESRPARGGDVVRCDVEMFHEGKSVTEKDVHLFIPAEGQNRSDFARRLEGAQLGEVREGVMEGRGLPYRLHVRDIRVRKLPDVNDDFAVSFGKKDLNDLKDGLRESLLRRREEEIRLKLKDDLCQILLRENQVEMPQGLVEEQKRYLLAKGLARGRGASDGKKGMPLAGESEEERDAERKARDQVLLFFILDRIAEVEGITIDPEEINKRIEEIARDSGQSPQQIRGGMERDLAEQMRQDKTLDFLLDQATIKEEAP